MIETDPKALSGLKNGIKNLEILSSDVFSKIQSDIKLAARHILDFTDDQSLPAPVRRAIAALDSHFESIDLSKAAAKWFPLLKSYVENTGLFFETRLEDIIHKFDDLQKSQGAKTLAEVPDIKQIFAKDLKPILLVVKEYLETMDSNSKSLDGKSFSGFRNTVDLLLADIVNPDDSKAPTAGITPCIFVLNSIKRKKTDRRIKIVLPQKEKTGIKSRF